MQFVAAELISTEQRYRLTPVISGQLIALLTAGQWQHQNASCQSCQWISQLRLPTAAYANPGSHFIHTV
jgi:hypothetical protein